MSIKPTDEQIQVIQHVGSPLRVLAGPGTGKTFSITRRIHHLIEVVKHPPSSIFAITFTNSAADEMRKRLEGECGIKSDQLPRVSTLHALAKGLLHQHHELLNLPRSFATVDKPQLRLILADVAEDLAEQGIRLSWQRFPRTDDYLRAYDCARSVGQVPTWVSRDAKQQAIYGRFAVSYVETLRFYGALDWTDIVSRALQLLKEQAGILGELREAVQHLLVDEYQDFNPLEQELVRLMVGCPEGLCVVGDDDQSIFESFRFADPGGIIGFPTHYQGATSLELTQCNRCPPEVIEKALRVIANNTRRASKELRPANPKKPGGVSVLSFRSKKAEVEWLVKKVVELTKEKYSYKEVLILFADGRVAEDYIAALRKAQIPLLIQLRLESIFDSQWFILMWCTLRMVVNEHDNLAVRECLEHWPGIGGKTMFELRKIARAKGNSLWIAIETVALHQDVFPELRQRKSVAAFFNYANGLKQISPYTELCGGMFKQYPDCSADKGCSVLSSSVESFKGKEGFVSLEEVLQQFEERWTRGELEGEEEQPNAVRIMTMHSAKGCEAPLVFIPALEDDIMPGQGSGNEEEKRRLFYVSLTRTKVMAFLSWASQRTGQAIHRPGGRIIGRTRSRFLDEMEGRARAIAQPARQGS